ncbi:MAG: ATP-dependent DNA helicase UvrD2 [Acidimicrobiales bacterium]|nr:ATP-dependent DNA helicase UvrD2 [Acidimicrobiales bacterium]
MQTRLRATYLKAKFSPMVTVAIDSLLNGLDEEQLTSVLSKSSPLIVIAGAGSGKTRVLTTRIALRVATDEVEAKKCMAITFTRKASQELNNRLYAILGKNSVSVGTFHSIALAELKRAYRELRLKDFTVIGSKTAIFNEIRKPLKRNLQISPALYKEVAQEIEWAKARSIAPESYSEEANWSKRSTSCPTELVATWYGLYEQAKTKANLKDFDDLILGLSELIENNRLIRDQSRWRYKSFYVDEFQDVNPSQYRLLMNWLGDGTDLCVVGDPNQAIYSWNGADPKLMLGLSRTYPGAQVISLKNNYRSTPEIVSASNQLIRSDEHNIGSMVSTRSNGVVPNIHECQHEAEELAELIENIMEMRKRGYDYSKQAVLARTNAQLPQVVELLDSQGIPLNNKDDYRKETSQLIDAQVAFIRTKVDSFPLQSLRYDLTSQFVSTGNQSEVSDVVIALDEYQKLDPDGSISSFLTWFTSLQSRQNRPNSLGVEVTTMHKAKGLEWPVVHVIGVEEGYLPLRPFSYESHDEEQRLFYVACTRANAELHLYWAHQRMEKNVSKTRKPSPWLSWIEPQASQAPVLSNSERVEKLRSILQASKKLDPIAQDDKPARHRIKQLRTWRLETSADLGVRPEVVISDATLVLLAKYPPADIQELRNVVGLSEKIFAQYGNEILSKLSN